MRAADVDVAWTPAGLEGIDLETRTVVVLDVLRSSTCILTALEAGAQRVFPAASTEEAMRIATSLGRANVLLCGERGGLKVDGYDLGNSPAEFSADRVAEAILVASTTNGTPAMRRAAGAALLLVGCLRNLSAVTERVRRGRRPVLFVCAGREGSVSLDDAVCAGRMVDALLSGDPAPGLPDGARAAREIARSLGPPTRDFLASIAAGRALVELGLGADLPFCATTDASQRVPEMRDGAFVLAE